MTDHITFFQSYYDAVADLPSEEFKEVLSAVFKYVFYGIDPTDLSPIAKGYFILMKPNLDVSIRKAESGKPGGSNSSKQADSAKSESKPEANDKQTISKVKANRKQSESKPEANDKQSSSDIGEGIGKGIEEGEGIEKGKGNEKGDGIKGDKNTSCSEQSEIASEPVADVAAVILNDGSEWRPTVAQYDEFCTLHPGIDVVNEFRKMRSWCIGNPSKRKTKRGVLKFVGGWLDRAQDSGGNRYGGAYRSRDNPQFGRTQDEAIDSVIRGDL